MNGRPCSPPNLRRNHVGGNREPAGGSGMSISLQDRLRFFGIRRLRGMTLAVHTRAMIRSIRLRTWCPFFRCVAIVRLRRQSSTLWILNLRPLLIQDEGARNRHKCRCLPYGFLRRPYVLPFRANLCVHSLPYVNKQCLPALPLLSSIVTVGGRPSRHQLGANPAMLEQLLMEMFVPDTAQVWRLCAVNDGA